MTPRILPPPQHHHHHRHLQSNYHLDQVTNESLHYINIWFYGIFLKLIPCIVLTILTALLVKALVEVKQSTKVLDAVGGIWFCIK